MDYNKPDYRVYIVFRENEWKQPKVVHFLVDYVASKGNIVDFGTGNAYNMPVYLLDVIEGYEDTAMVIALELEDGRPHPRFLVGEEEITPLIEALKANPGGDSWEIAVAVNKEIRAAEEQ